MEYLSSSRDKIKFYLHQKRLKVEINYMSKLRHFSCYQIEWALKLHKTQIKVIASGWTIFWMNNPLRRRS